MNDHARTHGSCARCARPLRPPAPPGSARTGRQPGVVVAVRHWPEGPVCSGCYAKACETYGPCPGCDTDRLLPGLRQGEPVCTDCAGGIGNFTCTRCGQEGWNHYKNTCGRCVLKDRLTTTLDDGTGTVTPALQPLVDHLVAMPRPRTGILWLTKPHTTRLLTTLAGGQVELTHDGLAELEPYRAVAHLRQLLVAAGVLPEVDPTLRRAREWSAAYLDDQVDPDDRHLLERYTRWHLHRRLRQDAARGLLHPYRDQNTRYALRQAHEFLTWLRAERTNLETLSQEQLDRWVHPHGQHQRSAVAAFLTWAARRGLAPPLHITPRQHDQSRPITQAERLTWLRRAALDGSLAHLDRVVLALMLLYAQPVGRIAQLRTQDIAQDEDGAVRIHLGTPPAPVPAPFDQILLDYATDHRSRTAANPDSPWLFPGRRGTLPVHPNALRLRLQHLGLQPRAARASTLARLTLQAPPAIVSQMLGYHINTTERRAQQAGSTWARYASTRASSG